MNGQCIKVLMGVLLLYGTVAGCSTMANRMDKFDKTVTAYNALIRWGDYQTAAGFRTKKDSVLVDTKSLKNIRVTSYEQKHVSFSTDGMTAYVIVEFGYYNEYSPRHRKYIDKQTWVYIDAIKDWRLDGDLPRFGAAGR